MQAKHIFFLLIAAVTALAAGAADGRGGSRSGAPTPNGATTSTQPVTRLVLRGPLVRLIHPEMSERDAASCRSWAYDGSAFKQHVRAMKQVPKSDWGRLCYQYACSAVGEAELDGRVHRVEVNAGGWISLKASGKAPTFWASEQQLPGFLAACNCCEDPVTER